MAVELLAYVKRKFATETRRRLLENFFSLSLLQAASYVFPLITVPYLTRVIGVEKFGLLAFGQAFVSYFGILADYGFSFSATREVSIHRNDKDKLSEIFSSVMLIKMAILLLSMLCLLGIVFSFEKFRSDWAVYLISFFVIAGGSIFPGWFFQGIEQMRYITILNVSARLFFTILVFLLVNTQEDFLYVPVLSALGAMISGAIALWMVNVKFGTRFYIPSWERVEFYLRDGWHVFTSMFFISLYTSSNTFLLGLLTNNTLVGYFSAADKLISAMKGFTAPISQTVYPYFSRLFSENIGRAKELLAKMLIVVGAITLVISVVVSIFAPTLVNLLFGASFAPAGTVMRIMIFVVFAIGLSNVMGVQGLLAFNYKKEFTKIVFICGFIHLIVFPVLVLKIGLLGAPIAVLFTEVLICLIQYPVLLKKRLL